MVKKIKKRVRREYTKEDVKELRAHSKAKTPVARIVRSQSVQKVRCARRQEPSGFH